MIPDLFYPSSLDISVLLTPRGIMGTDRKLRNLKKGVVITGSNTKKMVS